MMNKLQLADCLSSEELEEISRLKSLSLSEIDKIICEKEKAKKGNNENETI